MFMMGDELWTSTETSVVTKVDTTNLNTTGKADYKEALAVSKATAHPHTGRDGTVYNLGNSMEKVNSLEKVVVALTVGNLKMQGKTFVNVMKFPVPKTDESGHKSAFDQGEILARIPGPAGMIQPYYHRYFTI